MKISKLINLIVVFAFLFAFLPAGKAQAYLPVTDNTTISTDTTLTQDWVISSGAVLTIEPGVTITIACTDGGNYPVPDTDPDKIEIIVEDGTLIADGVDFIGATPNTSCWYGIRVLSEGDAEIDNSTIQDATRGVVVENSSPLITNNFIQQIHGEDSVTKQTKTAYGILVLGASAGPTITGNYIHDVYGGDGCTVGVCNPRSGANGYGIFAADHTNANILGNNISSIYGGNGVNGAAGENGENGAVGSSSHPTGYNAEDGSPGEAGGNGGDAYGIMAHTLSGNIQYNQISNIIGGNGALGGAGGTGGKGGDGYNWVSTDIYSIATQGGDGGTGGIGGAGGAGGNGGKAYGMFLWNSTLASIENDIHYVRSGLGRSGGAGGAGGAGGKGGNGTPIKSGSVYQAGYGGGGNRGGTGGAGGASGDSGEVYGIYAEGSHVSFTNNKVRNVASGNGASGAYGGQGGNGGAGGNGGLNNKTGDPSYSGAGGGNAFDGSAGGAAAQGGGSGKVYGMYIHNATVTSFTRNWVEEIVGGVSGGGGRSGAGGVGGLGGNASTNNPSAGGGDGGNGGSSPKGGNGGDSGYVYGMYMSNTSATLVNNVLLDVEGKAGGNGGAGYNGGNAGNGGSGSTQQGGDGGDGGNSGSGGNGGVSGWTYGLRMVNPLGTGVTFSVLNNTIVNVKAPQTGETATGGLAGTTVGTLGLGGSGSPAGANGVAGVLGSVGSTAVRSEAYAISTDIGVTADLYNNIIADYNDANNSFGVALVRGGTFNLFYNTVYGWDTNIEDGIDSGMGFDSHDPMFIDYSTEKDLHLSEGSPCIDTGMAKTPEAVDSDHDGTPRPLDGDGDKEKVIDRGAFEYGNFFTLGSSTMSVNEDGTIISFWVQQIGYHNAISTVEFFTQDGSAIGGTDYITRSATVGFPAGANGAEEYTVTINEDDFVEGNEIFSIRLRNPVNGNLGDILITTVTIVDNDGLRFYLPLIIR